MKTISSSLILLLCATAALPLTSCRIVGNKPDFGGVKDAFTPARDDEVYVESSGGASRPVAAASAPVAASPAPVAAAPATAPAAHGAGTYTVRLGDTLSGIARAHRVGLSALAAANGMTLQNALIKPGQVLRIPGGTSATSSRASKTATHAAPTKKGRSRVAASRYTVRKGDTMASIAHKQGVSLKALLKANELTANSARFVQPGAVITIPAHRR